MVVNSPFTFAFCVANHVILAGIFVVIFTAAFWLLQITVSFKAFTYGVGFTVMLYVPTGPLQL